MPSFGRSLRMYLADGSPTGIRHAEIVNWTGQAVVCPRTRMAELGGWPEVARPGVYFLIEGGLGTDRGRVYIGESENVLDRLGQHLKEKEFWVEAVAFTSKDDNLTKSHIRYLESRLIKLAQTAGRYDLDNGNGGQPSALPRADGDTMEEYLDNLRTVLAALGHRLLEPLTHPQPPPTTAGGLPTSTVLGTPLRYPYQGRVAHGFATDVGFLLLNGSQVSGTTTNTCPKPCLAQREEAIAGGRLVASGDHFVTTADIAFTSSSAAANFVAGASKSGPASWLTEGGVTLKHLEETAADAQQTIAGS